MEELGEPIHGPLPKGRGVSSDRCFARPLRARHSPIQRRDEFVKLARDVVVLYRHRVTP